MILTPPVEVSPRPRRSRPTIGLLTAGLRDPYATVTWSGVMEAARARDVNVLNLVGSRLHSPIDLEAPAQILFELVDPADLDGLVVFSEMLYHFVSAQELKRFLSRYGLLPMTSIGLLDGIPSVSLDIEEGMRRMVAHLVEDHDFRRLAYLQGPAGEETAEAEYRGYLRALAEHGIPFDANLVTTHPPSWGAQVGIDGARVLLEERRLKPGVDLDCIVGCADLEVLPLMASLQRRGIGVPYDVAVTGFNNLEAARLSIPPLTTVDRKIAELGRQATEMLLDLLEGKAVPESVILPPELVVRRSCGCVPGTVSRATARPVGKPEPRPEVTPAALREAGQRAAEMMRSGRPSLGSPDLSPDWSERLVESFIADLGDESTGAFFASLEETLRQVLAEGRNVTDWQDVISMMRQALRPLLSSGAVLAHAEDLWQQARILIGDFAERGQGRRRLDAAQQVETLSDITQSLITTFDVAGLMDVLARNLPQLGIPSGLLFLYEDPALPKGAVRLLLGYTERGRIQLEACGRRFPVVELAPAELLLDERRYDLVALPLYFQGDQLGLVVLEMGPRDGPIYEALRIQISSALKGALLATHNIELYQEAVAARKAAEEADNLKSRFLSTVSHELRTPLSLIVGTIEMLLRERSGRQTDLSVPYQRDLRSIRTSAQHLARLISDVLDLASSQAGELRLVCEPLRLSEVLAQATMLGEAMAREKNLSWQDDIPEDLPVVWGDRTRLQQVVLNLISNAIKFTEQGYIRLWAEGGRQRVVVAVTDSGMGIPSAEQEFIFDEFRQSERAARRGYGGMGLGLAISRRLVELHGGMIGVLSTGFDGAGSTFYFTLPAMQTDAGAAPVTEDRAGTVLILTEQASAGERLAHHLTARGFTVEIVVLEAHPNWLGQIIAAPPGAVVLDFEPAAERGWELMQLLRRNPATQDIPVVFYTLSGEEGHGAALALDFLVKPVAAAELAHALARQGLDATQCDRGRAILVVDDEPGMLALHARLLEQLAPKCRILKARNGQEALELMARQRPDLVLLDLMMPVLDGFGVLETMRERESTRDIPVIVLTAQILTSQDMARLQQGVAAVLSKGLFTGAEVLARVTDALSRNKRLGSEAQRVVRQAMAYIHARYAEPFSREELALAVGLNDRYLTQCFHEETGLTPVAYLNRYRIQQARALLERGEMNITEVALATGFSDPSYFARVFHAEIGVAPRAYQRGERAAAAPGPLQDKPM